MDVPETRYARTQDGVHLAYHVVGEGPVDLLWLGSFNGGLEILWEHPLIRSLTEKLTAFARVIRHDMRATGLSDRNPPLPDLETQVEDIRTVLDAAGSWSTVIVSAANPAGPLFAATHPRRTRALCFWDPTGRATWADDYPCGETPDEAERELGTIEATWGTDAFAASMMAEVAPTMVGDRDLVRWYARLTRHWVAPGDAVELMRRWNQTDIRDVLPTISVPTLCVAREFEGGNAEAEHVSGLIPGASLVVLPGEDRFSAAGDQGALVATIRGFVGASPSTNETDTVLRAVLFTDIVDSTATSARLGDAAWRELLERHHAVVRAQLARHGGTEVDTAGDGFFATFDGPARAVRSAQAIVEAVGALGIEVRAGVHAGECRVIDRKAGGITVTIGARVSALAGPSEVLISQTVKDLTAGSGLVLEDAGQHELKGVPDRWHLYRVID
ncbi:MAG: adenylate/guanylate cyclase domain-containing protein [Actinomycetota bacterium]